jgi:uncharacterized protein YrzB (UPF0473 family)
MSGDKDDLIILIDENGNEVEAEYLDTIEYRGNSYVVLLPKDELEHAYGEDEPEHAHGEDEDCDCEEVIILKIEQDADGDEDAFVAIEDEEEQNAVFEIFTRHMEETEFDEEDD